VADRMATRLWWCVRGRLVTEMGSVLMGGSGGVARQLTVRQQRLLADLCAEWLVECVRTGPARRLGAEDGVRLAYQQADLAPPSTVLWVDSPLRGLVLATMLAFGRDWLPALDLSRGDPSPALWAEVAVQVRARVDRQVGDRAWPAAGASLGEVVTRGGWSWLDDATQDILDAADVEWIADHIGHALHEVDPTDTMDDIRSAISDELSAWALGQLQPDGDWPAVGNLIRDAGYGQHEGVMLAYALVLREVRPDLAHLLAVDGLAQAGRCAGVWWPFTNVAVLCERPVELHLDARRRLHRVDQPAIRYPDDFGVWALESLLNNRVRRSSRWFWVPVSRSGGGRVGGS
jgi:hypothetical protein